jgi:ATP-binding cassette subfamily B multidrug efflux pump
MNAIYRLFERWIDPYRDNGAAEVPNTTAAFLWHFVKQAKLAFLAMLVLGGLVALMEAALFWFVGRLVDLLGHLTGLPAGTG